MNKHVKGELNLKGEMKDQLLVKHNKKQSVIIVNETAAELMADKIDKQKKEEKLAQDIKVAKNNAEVMAAAQEAAKEKAAEIKERDTFNKNTETIGEILHKSNVKKIEKELTKDDG